MSWPGRHIVAPARITPSSSLLIPAPTSYGFWSQAGASGWVGRRGAAVTTIGEAPRGVVALDHIAGARPASVRQSPWVAITAALAVTGDVLSGGTAVAVWSATTSDRPRDLTVTVALLCSAVGWAVLLRALRGRVAVVRLGSSLRLVLKAAVSTAAALALLSYAIPA